MRFSVSLKSRLEDLRSLFSSLHAVMVPLSFILFATGVFGCDFDVMLAGVVCLFCANVVYGCLDLRSRLLFLFLHGGIALFLLSRPVIGALNPDRTWLLSTVETTSFALTALYLSMMCLFIGTAFCGALTSWNEREKARGRVLAPKALCARGLDEKDGSSRRRGFARLLDNATGEGSDKLRCIRLAALICFLVCVLGSYYGGVIKLSYMEGLSYEDYYLISSSDHVPWAVDTLSVMMPYMLCAYLATMPKRLPATCCLGMYVLSTVPMLIIGSRGGFVIAFLFAALYYVFRSVIDDHEKWITWKLAVCAAAVVPVGVFFMGMWTYVRAGDTANLVGLLAVFEDAFYKQGVSFTVLGHGYDVNPQIQALGFKFYTAGAFIDNIAEGFLGTTFFGVEPLGNTNSAQVALQGRSYSHAMSFFAHPNYLGGEGYGSSYLLEWYADFGYGGIAVGSLILAAGLYLLSRSVGRSWFWGMTALVSSMSVFHMPRGTAAEWISFLSTTRFWLAMVLVALAAALLLYVSRLGDRPKASEWDSSDGFGKCRWDRQPSLLGGGCGVVPVLVKNGEGVVNRHGVPLCSGVAEHTKRNEMR